jgi:hypothetical protein
MGGEPALVRVAVAPNEAVARLWQSLLEAEGVSVLVRIAGPSLAYASPALDQHDLYARADQAERARDLLAAYSGAIDDDRPADDGDHDG